MKKILLVSVSSIGVAFGLGFMACDGGTTDDGGGNGGGGNGGGTTWACMDIPADPCDGVDCEDWESCDAGTCVDIPCYDNPCDYASGEACGGTARDSACDAEVPCFDHFDGYACPAGQICPADATAAADECVADPCDGVSCDFGTSCVDGTCVTNGKVECGYCNDTGPDADEWCNMGTCEAIPVDPCDGVTCEDWESCDATGTCVDIPCYDNPCDFANGEACGGTARDSACDAEVPCFDHFVNFACPDGEMCPATATAAADACVEIPCYDDFDATTHMCPTGEYCPDTATAAADECVEIPTCGCATDQYCAKN